MITLAVVAVMVSLAAPSMRTYVLNSRLTGASTDFLRALQAARAEATKRQHSVVVCASANPTASSPTCTTSSPTGWIVFDDFSVDGAATNGDWDRTSSEELISAQSFDSGKIHVLADNSKKISFAATGFTNVDGGTSSTTKSTAVVLCDDRGNVDENGEDTDETAQSVARGVIIATTGRAHITRTLSDINTLLGSTKINSSCPP